MSRPMTTTFIFCFLLVVMVPPVSEGAQWLHNVSESRLENGLKVTLLENHKAPAATLQVRCRAGARNDRWG